MSQELYQEVHSKTVDAKIVIADPPPVLVSPWRPAHAAAKRALDLVGASFGVLLVSPLLIVAAVAIKLDSRGPVLFRQLRMGRGMKPFSILKFRTMVVDAPQLGNALTVGRDPRITRVGRVLRRTKLDELPQLINVLKGDMSLVGPRPEVPEYVALYREDYERILTVRPGITGLASIKYRHEAEILAQAENPEHEYVTRVLPEKIALAEEYLRRATLVFDVTLMLKTLTRLFV